MPILANFGSQSFLRKFRNFVTCLLITDSDMQSFV
ncbi:hypothetical protein T11_7458 [Trichinella zimbabwensis]|uniref:Uncharacterized protein n=1 Tax=Trichinella zimbabwensis TaxID=268475 RepID=A0A0V1GFC1_9BILA|nr:hypothetical protein T11_7458 [Trichinella zimbabwensis]